MGGRGAGKTRAAAEWVTDMVAQGYASSIALIGATLGDVRNVMVGGKSGLLAIAPPELAPKYEPSKRILTWANGAIAYAYSAEVPDSLRGPQFDLAWGDELAAWADGDAVLDVLRPALRLGENPKVVLTTTPRPVPWVKDLLLDETCVITRSSTRDNAANLAKGVVDDLERRFDNSIWARQELFGELIEDPEGALWSRDDIKRARALPKAHDFDTILIAVDPPATKGKNADACGIIIAGKNGKNAWVIDDLTTQGQAPNEWAAVIAKAYEKYAANYILAEGNQGGEMVREIIKLQSPEAMVRLVHASKSKRVRAEPVALLYAQNRICHNRHFPALEDEMCSFGTQNFRGSPNRMDALVHALTHLLLVQKSNPKIRPI